jgi:subtilisin family serine protease
MIASTGLKPVFPTRDYVQGATDGMAELPSEGRGVTVAVFDSGVRPHADFGDRLLPPVLPEFSLEDLRKHFPETSDETLTEYLDFYRTQTRENPDLFGHGTHAASLISGDGKLSQGRFKGVAPAARIQPIQVAVGGPQARGLFF